MPMKMDQSFLFKLQVSLYIKFGGTVVLSTNLINLLHDQRSSGFLQDKMGLATRLPYRGNIPVVSLLRNTHSYPLEKLPGR